jgi:hypothetical protein
MVRLFSQSNQPIYIQGTEQIGGDDPDANHPIVCHPALCHPHRGTHHSGMYHSAPNAPRARPAGFTTCHGLDLACSPMPPRSATSRTGLATSAGSMPAATRPAGPARSLPTRSLPPARHAWSGARSTATRRRRSSARRSADPARVGAVLTVSVLYQDSPKKPALKKSFLKLPFVELRGDLLFPPEGEAAQGGKPP